VIIRPSISTIAAFCPAENKDEDADRFVIIKEFRSTVENADGFVYELPGGASLKPNVDMLLNGQKELKQETGVEIPLDKFAVVGRYQMAATMVANTALLLKAELTAEEMNAIAAKSGEQHGNANETERTYLYVMTRKEIMEGNKVDLVTRGMVALVRA
jgi:hypothetical protein